MDDVEWDVIDIPEITDVGSDCNIVVYPLGHPKAITPKGEGTIEYRKRDALIEPVNGMIRPIISGYESYPNNIPPHPKPIIKGYEVYWDGEWKRIISGVYLEGFEGKVTDD